MKILHVADTHLGYSAYRKATEDGINQREIDIYNAFEQFIDYAIDTKPDLIIHAGDLFDSVRPNNRAITFAVKQLIRLSYNKIPIVIIAGNHEHPKLKETGHIFSIFDHIENVYPVYNSKYEILKFKLKDERIDIHAIPQCNNKSEYNKEIKKLKPNKESDFNLFITHGSVTSVKDYYMNEFNELIIPAKIISKNFDYIALGHFHKYTKLAENTYYSGSIESLTFTDAGDKKGFLELNIKERKIAPSFIEIKTRPMIDIKPIKCSNLQLDQIMKKIKQTVTEIKPKEKTYRLTLEDIPAHIYRGLDFNVIRKLSTDAIHYEIKVDMIKDDKINQYSSSKINDLVNEFKQYIKGQEIKEKEILLKLGIGYIEKIEARDEGK